MRIPSGYLYYDTPIGILCLDTLFPKPPGQLRNPLTFDFPVVCRVLRGVGAKEILSSTSAQLETLFVDAARELERDGVKAIAGSCGFMALFQKAVASAVSVPVLMSSLVQIPLIHTLHGPGCRIGVLTAHSGSLTPEHFRQAGVPDAQIDALAIAGMENFPVFRKTILEGAAPVMDTDAVGAEIRGNRGRHDGRAAAGRPAARMHGSERIRPDRAGGGFRPGLRYQFPDRLRGLLRAAEPVGVTGNRPPQT
ncbi:aspartate/glutamate racemase family protein [Bilophila wadsworthia]|uniref:aspartate/glutamate racemase family protein n=1 Tax=Bilophila wadsworthia TaxID=35833 RepID=UPI003990612F